LNAKPSNQEKSKRYSRTRLWWHLFRFRFALGRGKPLLAYKFLDRIPLPDAAVDKAAFQAEEETLWGRYVNRDGNLRLVTWGNIVSTLLKTLIGLVVIAGLLWGVYHLAAFYKEYKELRSKSRPAPKFQPDIKTGKEFKLLDGKSMMIVDMAHSPVSSDKTVYLPVPVLDGGKSHLFYLPDKKFAGKPDHMTDGGIARTFTLADGQALSYVYYPGEPGTAGTWLDQPQRTELKAALKSGNVFFVPEGQGLELRSESWEKAKPVVKIPGGTRLIFVGFAPVSSLKSKFVWVQVKYPASPGQYRQGWLPAVSLEKTFVKEGNEPGILEITAGILSFRDAPSQSAARIPGVINLTRGASVEFLKFAPLANILSSKYAMIQVKYAHKPGKNYTGWIYAGKKIKK